jgi:hypothetical protein
MNAIAPRETPHVGIFWLVQIQPAKRGCSPQAARWTRPSHMAIA